MPTKNLLADNETDTESHNIYKPGVDNGWIDPNELEDSKQSRRDKWQRKRGKAEKFRQKRLNG